MKRLILIITFMLGLNIQAQTLEKDIKGCMVIVKDLFDDRMIDTTQKEHIPYDYYWGKPCDSTDPEFYWILCDRFIEKYKENLTKDLYCKMIEGDRIVYTKDIEDGRCILFHWTWIEDGKQNDIYIDFTIKGDVVQISTIRKYLADFWK